MKKVLFILFLFISLLSYTQEKLNDTQNIRIGVVLNPIIMIPENIQLGKDFKISLINGLSYDIVKWEYNGEFLNTPENLILNFKEPGIYIPHILNNELKSYKIEIY